MMTVGLTGGSGYLSGHVFQVLTERGHRVCLMREDGPFWPEVEVVVHLRWYSTAGDGQPDLQRHCLRNTVSLVDSLLPHQRLIFASTASVYGDNREYPLSENFPIAPNCAYSRAKESAEFYINSHLWAHSTVFRFGSLMGLGITRTKVEVCVNAMATAGWNNKRVEVWHPDARKPVLHVRDAAELVADTCERPELSGTYNAAEGSYRANEIAEVVRRITGAEVVEVPDGTGRPGGVPSGARSCRLDCSRLRAAFPPRTYRGLWATVRELEGYRPREGDRNVPWVLPAAGREGEAAGAPSGTPVLGGA